VLGKIQGFQGDSRSSREGCTTRPQKGNKGCGKTTNAQSTHYRTPDCFWYINAAAVNILAVPAPDGKCICAPPDSAYPSIIVTDNGHGKIFRTETKTKKGLGQVDKYAMIVRIKRIDTLRDDTVRKLT
jgi:hypothetical protein